MPKYNHEHAWTKEISKITLNPDKVWWTAKNLAISGHSTMYKQNVVDLNNQWLHSGLYGIVHDRCSLIARKNTTQWN